MFSLHSEEKAVSSPLSVSSIASPDYCQTPVGSPVKSDSLSSSPMAPSLLAASGTRYTSCDHDESDVFYVKTTSSEVS